MRVLSKTELKEITGKTYSSSQIRELRHLGIEHKVRSDGSPLVFEANLTGSSINLVAVTEGQPNNINWSAI